MPVSSLVNAIIQKNDEHTRVEDLMGSRNALKLTANNVCSLWWDNTHTSVLIEDIFMLCNKESPLYMYYYWDKKESMIEALPVADHKEYDELVVFLGSLVQKVVDNMGMTTKKRNKLISHMISKTHIKPFDKPSSKPALNEEPHGGEKINERL